MPWEMRPPQPFSLKEMTAKPIICAEQPATAAPPARPTSPKDAQMAAVETDNDKHGATRVTLTPNDNTQQPLYYVLVKESFYDNLQDYKMWPAGLLLYGGEGVQKTDMAVCRQKAAPPVRQIRGYLDMGEV